MQFENICIENWRQFNYVNVNFHPRLTILTGTNGSGKTTILNMLSRSLGWQISLLSLPKGEARDVQDLFPDLELPLNIGAVPFGRITLANKTEFNLQIDHSGGLSVSYGPIKGGDGVYITSHRQLFSYSRVQNIPTSNLRAQELLENYTNRLKKSYQTPASQELVKGEEAPAFRIKQSLMALAMFGEGNSIVQPNIESAKLFRGFEDVLRLVLPEEVGFRKLLVKIPELYVVGTSGVFPLEAISGGIAATIDLAWQVFLASQIYDDFVVLIDEPENHLHPALQNRLLGDFLNAFPTAQFIVATHSPLMITSVKESRVYVLSPSKPGQINSIELDFLDRSSSASETLQNVLGVDGITPQWAKHPLEALIAKYSDKHDDPNALRQLKLELSELGLGGQFSRIIGEIAQANR